MHTFRSISFAADRKEWQGQRREITAHITQHALTHLGLLVRVVNACEAADLAGPGRLVESLGVARLADGQRGLHIDLNEAPWVHDASRPAPVLLRRSWREDVAPAIAGMSALRPRPPVAASPGMER